ncbi:MAG: WYL domain-containing protein [Clostridiales bacterium]|nr:WYL domain-containing protein [Clostridiales bacterium]
MNRDTEDKSERILSIYSRLKEGRIIDKAEESAAFGVNPRTIQRDISDIQNFLKNQNSETGEVQEVIYDREARGYRLQTKVQKHLQPKELLAVCKVLLESRSLVADEMTPIIHKLVNTCSEGEDRKRARDYIGNELHHYNELHHGKKLLDRIWELERAVREQRYIQIRYKKLKHNEEVMRKVKPVGVMFSEFYYYLTAFIEDIDREKAFQNPGDPFPTIYRIDRLEDVEVLDEHFSVPYAERFEEGEFRKRVQFMYGGRLQRVKFQYSGPDIDAVLDRLPTAQVVSEEDGVYTVTAEVFGSGIEMWLRSQPVEYVQIFSPTELKENMCIAAENILKNYNK